MSAKTFTAPASGPVGFEVDASAVHVEITIDPDAAVASAELSGPAEIVDGARSTSAAGRWALTLPRPHPTVIGGFSVVTAGGATVVVGDSMTFVGGRLAGGVNLSSVAVIEAVRLVVTLPAGSRLAARLDAGTLATCGQLPAAEVTATAADVFLDAAKAVQVRTVSGDITVHTLAGTARLRSVSGDIAVNTAAGPVTAETTSGDITAHAAAAVTIDAASVSGDIRVTAAPGICPDVRARSVSGQLRTAGGTR